MDREIKIDRGMPGRIVVRDRVPAYVVEQVSKLVKEGYTPVSGLESEYEVKKDGSKTIMTKVFFQVVQKETD